jgi:hypothetical protein
MFDQIDGKSVHFHSSNCSTNNFINSSINRELRCSFHVTSNLDGLFQLSIIIIGQKAYSILSNLSINRTQRTEDRETQGRKEEEKHVLIGCIYRYNRSRTKQCRFARSNRMKSNACSLSLLTSVQHDTIRLSRVSFIGYVSLIDSCATCLSTALTMLKILPTNTLVVLSFSSSSLSSSSSSSSGCCRRCCCCCCYFLAYFEKLTHER